MVELTGANPVAEWRAEEALVTSELFDAGGGTWVLLLTPNGTGGGLVRLVTFTDIGEEEIKGHFRFGLLSPK